MKKTIALTAAFMLSFSAMSLTALAAEEDAPAKASSVSVYVNISDAENKIVVANEYINVSDADNDSNITINDVFITAHDEFFEGGSEAGYTFSVKEQGLWVDKFWGVEGGNYGYCLNNEFASGLTQLVKEGDTLNTFFYQDTENYSDSYSFFDVSSYESTEPDAFVTLTLLHKVYDKEYNTSNEPLEGAVITVNGEPTEDVTNEEGVVSLKFSEEGTYVISATSDKIFIAPPVCVVKIGENNIAAATTTTTEAAATTTAAEETTTTAASEETTTTAADTTTKAATTTKATTTKAATTTTAKTTASQSASPKTGDAGVGAALAVIFTAVGTAFTLRKKD